MPSVAEGALSLLVAAGVGDISSNAWTIRVGKLDAEPNRMIVLYDTGGQNPNPRWLLDFKTFQALIRGDKDGYSAAYAKALEVQDALLGLEPQDVGPNHWSGVTGAGDIAFLRYDDKSRPLFSVNFRVLLERPTNALTHRESL